MSSSEFNILDFVPSRENEDSLRNLSESCSPQLLDRLFDIEGIEPDFISRITKTKEEENEQE